MRKNKTKIKNISIGEIEDLKNIKFGNTVFATSSFKVNTRWSIYSIVRGSAGFSYSLPFIASLAYRNLNV